MYYCKPTPAAFPLLHLIALGTLCMNFPLVPLQNPGSRNGSSGNYSSENIFICALLSISLHMISIRSLKNLL